MTVDVIILTYKPGAEFLALMDCLREQTVKPEQIIIVNTEQKYFTELITEESFHEKYDNSVIIHLGEAEFDHGNSRNLGVSASQADCFVMMTQDAVPADEFLLARLVRALTDEKTAVAYARQRPTAESDELERFIHHFNYGKAPLYKTVQDVERLGIKVFFCSNACAVYRAAVFRKLGGFIRKTIFNEDMIYAAAALRAGYAIQYVPAAAVFHAHNYTGRQQFKRNFDLGVSHADHPAVFAGLRAEGEGLRMVVQAAKHLLKCGRPGLIAKLFWQSMAKYVGYRMGKGYRRLPLKRIRKYTMNQNYWRLSTDKMAP